MGEPGKKARKAASSSWAAIRNASASSARHSIASAPCPGAGSIRGDFATTTNENLVHGSDGPESAKTELALFFGGADEVVAWDVANLPWIYSVEEELR